VDIDAADRIVKIARKQARATFTPEVIGDLGFLAGYLSSRDIRSRLSYQAPTVWAQS